MRVLIVEDERHNSVRLKQMLRELRNDIKVVSTLESVTESVEYLSAKPDLSLIFMDIRLSDGLCFEIFSSVKIEVPIIFTTAYDEYALRAFKFNSIDYLLKPFTIEDLSAALLKHKRFSKNHHQQEVIQELFRELKGNRTNYRSRFLVQKGGSFRTIEVENISYIYSEFKNTFLSLNDRSIVSVNFTLDELEAELDPQYFFRANRQHIIRSSSITGIFAHFGSKLKVLLKGNGTAEIMISKEKSMALKKWLDR